MGGRFTLPPPRAGAERSYWPPMAAADGGIRTGADADERPFGLDGVILIRSAVRSLATKSPDRHSREDVVGLHDGPRWLKQGVPLQARDGMLAIVCMDGLRLSEGGGG